MKFWRVRLTMKKIVLTTALCLSLTACESTRSMEWPSMSSLNPFSNGDTAQADVKNSQNSQPQTMAVNQSALQTELSEIEMLTGEKPKTFDTRPAPVIATPSTEPESVEVADVEPLKEPIDTIKTAEKTVEPATTPIEQAEPVATETTTVIEPENNEILSTKAEEAVAVAEVKPPMAANPVVATEPPIEAQKIIEPIATETTTLIEPAKQTVVNEPIAVAQRPIQQPMVTDTTPIYNDPALKLSSATGCPNIQIMPSARSITYFESNMSGQMIARASINEIRGGCEVVKGGMELDLDILMKGTITNKGRFEGKKDEEAFMTFPYFVTIATPQGLPVDKKIMATAMRFRPSVDYLDHAEKITQFIPMDNVAEAANYKVTVGYQLTRKQLEYNRVEKSARPDDRRASPDTIPAKRRSVNPLKE